MKKIVKSLIDKIGSKRVVIIGDVMLDEYVLGTVSRISPEAPIPVVKKVRDECCLGGAANVAANCKNIGLEVSLIGVVNTHDDAGKKVQNALHELGASLQGVVHSPRRVTTSKTRIMAGSQQCVRVDKEDTSVLSEKERRDLVLAFDASVRSGDVILFSDYAKGVLDKKLIEYLMKKSESLGCTILADPKGPDFSKYAGVHYLKPNLLEFTQMCNQFGLVHNEHTMVSNGRAICEKLKLKALIVTLGEKGICYISQEEEIFVPAYKKEVYDLSGAGDTVFAFLALAFAHNLSIRDALRISNKAASVAVSHLKTYAVNLHELLSDEQDFSNKIVYDWTRLKIELDWLRAEGKRVVFTNGCFDLLHSGHVHLLQEAKKRGDILLVALNSDNSVKRQGKGSDRPINTLHERSSIVVGIKGVDFVTSFDQDTPGKIIDYLMPDVVVKGGDYQREEIVGFDTMMRLGGEVYIVDLIPGRSTTGVVKKMNKVHEVQGSQVI